LPPNRDFSDLAEPQAGRDAVARQVRPLSLDSSNTSSEPLVQISWFLRVNDDSNPHQR